MGTKKDWPFEVVSLALISGASAIGWLIFGSHKVFAGVWAGGLIGAANFRWLGSIVKGALTQGKTAIYIAKYLFKFLLVAVLSAMLIYSRLVDPLAFMAGFTIIIIVAFLQGTEFISRGK